VKMRTALALALGSALVATCSVVLAARPEQPAAQMQVPFTVQATGRTANCLGMANGATVSVTCSVQGVLPAVREQFALQALGRNLNCTLATDDRQHRATLNCTTGRGTQDPPAENFPLPYDGG
jgi:hypothetical protein